MSEGPILILSPALASSNNGNWRTAGRWQKFLSGCGPTSIQQCWNGEPAGALIALHARRSADSIARFRRAEPGKPVTVVLTGTDVYGTLELDPIVRESLQCASHIVVLQPQALQRLSHAERAKARVIVQSAQRVVRHDKARRSFDFVAVGHLRDEKDPRTLMEAASLLKGHSGLRIMHIGTALDPQLGEAARQTMSQCPNYRWIDGLPAPATRRWIARARALVHTSRLEGGANVVIEAVRSNVPVLASRIDGNVGLLGDDYEGYFAVGDAAGLANLMLRFASEPSYEDRLRVQCELLDPLFAPEAESDAIRMLWMDMQRPRL